MWYKRIAFSPTCDIDKESNRVGIPPAPVFASVIAVFAVDMTDPSTSRLSESFANRASMIIKGQDDCDEKGPGSEDVARDT